MSMDDRNSLVDEDRLGSNVATERLQPHHMNNKAAQPLPQWGAKGVISTISRGPSGVGAVYEFADAGPTGGYHQVSANGALPTVQRAVGA